MTSHRQRWKHETVFLIYFILSYILETALEFITFQEC